LLKVGQVGKNRPTIERSVANPKEGGKKGGVVPGKGEKKPLSGKARTAQRPSSPPKPAGLRKAIEKEK